MHGTESIVFSDISATTEGFAVRGGRYVWQGIGNVTTAVTLDALQPDGVTWQTVDNITGAAATSGPGSADSWWFCIDLCPGIYRMTLNSATGVYSRLTSLPTR